ncbi:MAG: flagellar M-ring protein FliF [Variibacter sp.]|nr:flagellar M-ring protein FliF [Variibacter sp.]
MQGLTELLRTIGVGRLAAMAAVSMVLVGFFGFIIMRVASPQLVLLFSDLSPADSGAIVKELERQAIPYEVKGDGSSIMVPKEQVARVRMKLAEGGLPKGAGVGYEIFDKSDVLGATSFVQNINHLRALEGELARTIRAIDRVQAARVHLVIPERPLFSRDKVEPSASIVVKVQGRLEPPQVRAIRHLIASAVNGLKPERVSIVDEAGQLLADGSREDPNGGIGAAGLERQQAMERRMRDQIESIVASVVGPGRVRVQLTADFDLNRVTQTSDTFDPEGRVLRSSQTREETSSSGQTEGQVTVGNELPGGTVAGAPTAAPRDQAKKSEEIVNYEISRTTKTEVVEGGRIKRISAAVLVDGIYTRNEKGESTYQPRGKEDLDRIAALVRTAIGFDQKRGDQIEVVNLRFAEAPVAVINEPTGWMSMLQFTKADIMRGVELAMTTILGLLVLLFVVRPLVGRIIAPDAGGGLKPDSAALPTTTSPSIVGGALAGPGATQSAAAHGSGQVTSATSAAMLAEHAAGDLGEASSKASKMIDIAQVRGQVHAQAVQKVGELAERNPHETVAIIRQWLHDSPA